MKSKGGLSEPAAFFTLIYINTNRDLNYMRYTKILVCCIHNCSDKVSSRSEEKDLAIGRRKEAEAIGLHLRPDNESMIYRKSRKKGCD